MRTFSLACVLVLALPTFALAKDLPGPRIKNEPPFNAGNIMSAGGISCPKSYARTQLATDKRAIVADVKECVRMNFGMEKDIGLAFGSGDYSECVIPSTYDAAPPANNPVWPVCCAVEIPDGNYRMSCRVYFTPKQ